MKTNSILKWKPIIDNLPIKNENIKNHLANYFEYLASGPEYLKYYDLKTYRDLKIKNILYG